MGMAAFASALHVAMLATAALASRARHALLLPWSLLRQALARPAERLLIAPQDIRTSDPTIAEDIYAGYFAFAGRIVNAHGRSPFDLDPPTEAWLRGLCGFAWLRHLRAADTALARANGRALVDDFIGHEAARSAMALEPRVAARRLISMLSQSPVILEDADRAFYRRFMRHLSQSKARLQRQLDGGLEGDARLPAAMAVAFHALCASVPARAERHATRQLERELGRQILADGGHVSRNPRPVVDLLLDLLPLRQAYAARDMAPPQPLMNAIDRMMPMLRMFRHGDGGLALFNGMGVTAPDTLAIALAYDDAHARPTSNARYSGYQRLEAGGAVLLLDAGVPPVPRFSAEAHAGCLAFELSDRDQRIVVNCGAPDAARVEMREAARTTAAHSTLTLDDASSCQFAGRAGWQAALAGRILQGPVRVPVERREEDGHSAVDASHDGYVLRFGYVHHRSLALSADGGALLGSDALAPARGRGPDRPVAFALRFHLHPNVSARLDDGHVLLSLANGERWRFAAEGFEPRIEESIYFAAANGPRQTRQIALLGEADGEVGISWSLTRA